MKLFHSAIPWPLSQSLVVAASQARLAPGEHVELGHQLLDRLAGRLQQPVRGGLLGVVAAGVDQPVAVHLLVRIVGQQQRDLPRVGRGDRGRAAPLRRRPGLRGRVHADLDRQAAQAGAAGEGLHLQGVHPFPGGLQLERGPARVLPRDHVNHLPLRAAQGEPGTVHQQQHDVEPGLGHRQRRAARPPAARRAAARAAPAATPPHPAGPAPGTGPAGNAAQAAGAAAPSAGVGATIRPLGLTTADPPARRLRASPASVGSCSPTTTKVSVTGSTPSPARVSR